jgi:hypothetical protein
MYISRPSEPRTVLLWGDRWWFAGGGASPEVSDLAEAAEVLVAHYANEPKPLRLRLVFQPDTLETVTVACPRGDRATLADALSGEFPALADPAHAWSHDPVQSTGEGFSTLLHFETRPGLLALATRLAQHGLAVDSAWPLTTFLHAMPDEWSNSGAVTVVALQSHRAIAYRHPADGGRTALRWQGDAVIADVGRWLGALLALNAEEPVLLICADDAAATALGTFFGVERYTGVELETMSEALARPVVLPRYHSAQLLPRLPVVTANRVMIAASIALILASGWLGFGLARDHIAARAAAANHQDRLTLLRAEVGHLRENEAEIAALRRSLEGGAAGPPCGALLEKISTTLPAEVTLASLRVTGRSIALDGWVAPGAGRSPVDEWRARLTPASAPWTVESKLAGVGTFSLTGVFRP